MFRNGPGAVEEWSGEFEKVLGSHVLEWAGRIMRRSHKVIGAYQFPQELT